MLHEEIDTVYLALGALAGKIPQEEWEVVRLCRRNLLAAGEVAKQMESWTPPQGDEQPAGAGGVRQ
jgi:hypothetical protein